MKKNVLKRSLAMVLALVMLLSAVPAGVFAAVGDITTENTGIVNSTMDTGGSINWPVKIYDYLNDGMLFEPATSVVNSYNDNVNQNYIISNYKVIGGGAEYGGGDAMPITAKGTDFTADASYSKVAFKDTSIGGYYTRTRVKAVRFESPQYMRVTAGSTSGDRRMPFNYFESDEGQSGGRTKDTIRYAVLVYRSNNITADASKDVAENQSVQLQLRAPSGSYYRAVVKQGDSNIWINSPKEWTYIVVDLKSGMSEASWDDFTNITAVNFICPMEGTGAYFDISHLGFFGSATEAENYAKAALSFVNNPGEHLNDEHKITLAAGTPTYYTYPTASAPTWNFSLKHKHGTIATSGTSNLNRFGMNFVDGTGKNMTTYQGWVSGSPYDLYTGSTPSTFTPTKMTIGAASKYISMSSDTTTSEIILAEFEEDELGASGTTLNGGGYLARYMVLVYRASGYTTSEQFSLRMSGYTTATYVYETSGYVTGYTKSLNFKKAQYNSIDVPDGWVCEVVDLTTVYNTLFIKYLGMKFPTGSDKRLDIAYVGFFGNQSEANAFGTNATAYMNQGIKVQTGVSGGQTETLSANRNWNAGNNRGFGLLLPSNGGTWGSYGGTMTSGASNSYYTYAIGEKLKYASDYTSYNGYRKTNDGSGSTISNQIYYVDSVYANSTSYMGDSSKGFYTAEVPFDQYTLLTYVTSGKFSGGMLEGALGISGKDRKPVYRQETVEYVAELLSKTLTIPETDSSDNYNFNFVKGTTSSKFAQVAGPNGELTYVDLNGDGQIGMVDLDGDTHAETNEASVDLATALRHCLGIKFSFRADRGTTPTMGTYAETYAKDQNSATPLKGDFAVCRKNITTCMDAAYYLLNSIFYENSYNQLQTNYNYLTLGKAEIADADGKGTGKYAYVFDAGFAKQTTNENGETISQSALVYDKTKGTISIPVVDSKDLIYISETVTTTRFPFLPVTDSTGDFAGETRSPYFTDDGIRDYTTDLGTYRGRNYNYVMASNGEFVYFEEEDLFFEFEGDDDVYLFINGQLVLDIGGAHTITKVNFKVNDYVEWARNLKKDAAAYAALSAEEQARVDALALEDEQICSFDFYYMERHGYGANCRIVTNMHVTDPNLKVEKSAQQFGGDISYGGMVEPAAPIGYTFKLTNTGNTKLYNMSFTDDVIGVTLDPEKGLVIEDGWNGAHVFDSKGGTLEASDLTATVISGDIRIPITFADNTALINFLKTLNAEGTEDGLDGAEVTHAGSGLWVDSAVVITGMYYLMNADQKAAGMVHNTVYVTATNKSKTSDAGCQTLRSDASHRVYTAGAPVYYQWAGHEVFLSHEDLLGDSTGLVWKDSKFEDMIDDNHLSKYGLFFAAAGKDTANIHTELCDKKGIVQSYKDVKFGEDNKGTSGLLINYSKSGSYVFYVLMYLSSAKTVKYTDEKNIEQTVTLPGYNKGTSVGDMSEGSYAIVPVTVTVTDVKESTFVLDYGLGTESLDMDGELFNQDELFGSSGSVKAKLMGVTTKKPSYLAPTDEETAYLGPDYYNRIDFNTWILSGVQNITPFVESGKADGVFNVNLNIPQHGHPINYDSTIGGYTISGVGTMTIKAEVPSSWSKAYLHYWYDNGETPVGWPGTAMECVSTGDFELDIPGNVTNVLIHNGSGEQTIDLHVTAGVESTVSLSTQKDSEGNIKASVICSVGSTAYIKAPGGWTNVYMYSFDLTDTPHKNWPGVQVTERNADGDYVVKIPGDTGKIVISDGSHVGHNQTIDLDIDSGRDVWIDVLDKLDDVYGTEGELAGQIQYYRYRAAFAYSQDPVTIHAKVPSTWGGNVSIYAWYSGTTNDNARWPGQPMYPDENGWYSLELVGDYDSVIVTDGIRQTQNLMINPGMETWLTIEDGEGVHAKVPSDWGSNIYLYAWDSVSENKNAEWPGVKMTKGSDGYYHLKVTDEYDRVIINNGKDGGKQTEDLTFFVNQDTWITVNTNGKVHADVSAVGWGNANLYAWNDGGGKNAEWPGKAMSYSDGWYTLSSGGSYGKIIINGSGGQTADLPISPGAEVKVTLTGRWTNGQADADIKYVATVDGECPVNISYTADGSKEGITFTPTQIMSNKNVMWMAITVHSAQSPATVLGNPIDINNEVQMFKKITVLPANVVYYEDDFSGITYNKSSTTNSFTHHGNGSGSLTQSVDQSEPYGHDDGYQSGTNVAVSGDSLTKVQIKGTEQVAAFTFTGTGFELISRTNAFDSATIVMKVYGTTKKSDGTLVKDATPLQHVPLVTEFDNGNNGGSEEIYQVPALRVKDLAHGTYIVEISGNPSYDFSKWDGNLDTINDCMIDTYLYIDGIRIFQPLGQTDDLYNTTESGALFYELRDLIVAGKVAVAKQDGTSFQVSAGTTTWTENLLGDDFATGSAAFVGNQVDSSDSYLIQGPNNEVYMDGTVSNTALVFLVTEQSGAANRELQIALRALDYGKFYGVGSTGPDVRVEYGIRLADGNYSWRPLVNSVSSTEQYYSIPYAQCPKLYDADGNFVGYQVALRAVNGQTEIPAMVSYTSLKALGLEIQSVPGTGEKTILYYKDGILVTPDYYLQGTVNSEPIDEMFWNGKLTMTFEEATYVYIRRVMDGQTGFYHSAGALGTDVTSAALTAVNTAPTNTANMLYVPAGEITFTLKESADGVVTLSYTVSDELEGEAQAEVASLNLFSLRQQMSVISVATAQIDTGERVRIPGLTATYASLSFEDEIHYNIYYTAENTDDVVEMGLAIFGDRLADGIIDNAIQVIPGYVTDGNEYMVHTGGIPAKNMADMVYFKIYAKLSDGSYTYSEIAGYNAVLYAQAILKDSQNPKMKSLVVAVLNYGAEAQRYFGYNTDTLMNACLTAEQQALVDTYDKGMVADLVSADSSKTGYFPKSADAFTYSSASVSFEGAFSLNYYFTPAHPVDGEMTMYCWNAADYAEATVLTAENATGSMLMVPGVEYWGAVEGIAAKAIDETIYVAVVYTSEGVTYTSGVLAFSIGRYCEMIAEDSGSEMQFLAQATAVYGYYAKQYFFN